MFYSFFNILGKTFFLTIFLSVLFYFLDASTSFALAESLSY